MFRLQSEKKTEKIDRHFRCKTENRPSPFPLSVFHNGSVVYIYESDIATETMVGKLGATNHARAAARVGSWCGGAHAVRLLAFNHGRSDTNLYHPLPIDL